MRKIILVNSENTELLEEIKNGFKQKNIEYSESDNVDFSDYTEEDLIIYTTFEKIELQTKTKAKILKLHPSLLPAFDCKNAIEEAYKIVKVTGVTVSGIQNEKEEILAQYPVLIGLTTNYCDLVSELKAISKKLYPVVIDAVISDRVFDFGDLFKSSCSSNGSSCGSSCGGCGKCSN